MEYPKSDRIDVDRNKDFPGDVGGNGQGCSSNPQQENEKLHTEVEKPPDINVTIIPSSNFIDGRDELLGGEKDGQGGGSNKSNLHGNSAAARGESFTMGSGGIVNKEKSLTGLNRTKKKPFNIMVDKHPKKPQSVSPIRNKRPRKRTRLDMVDPFLFPIGDNSKEINNSDKGDSSNWSFDLNRRLSSAGSDPDSLSGTTLVNDTQDRGINEGVSQEEMEETIRIGKIIGADLTDHRILVEESLAKGGINEVRQ
ncbi:hypothetical protein Hanom_Chr03g00186101 [Helianthus anomalus]